MPSITPWLHVPVLCPKGDTGKLDGLGQGGMIRTFGPSAPNRVRYQAALHPELLLLSNYIMLTVSFW